MCPKILFLVGFKLRLATIEIWVKFGSRSETSAVRARHCCSPHTRPSNLPHWGLQDRGRPTARPAHTRFPPSVSETLLQLLGKRHQVLLQEQVPVYSPGFRFILAPLTSVLIFLLWALLTYSYVWLISSSRSNAFCRPAPHLPSWPLLNKFFFAPPTVPCHTSASQEALTTLRGLIPKISALFHVIHNGSASLFTS